VTEDILHVTKSVLLFDWPSPDVPDTLRAAGYDVYVKNGPGPEDFNPSRPEHVDLVYSHRPLAELPGIVAAAAQLGASAVWLETGSDDAREIVESAGLRYVDAPNIADAVRALRQG
jgi:CoA binding domain